jgi:hypothetical protein
MEIQNNFYGKFNKVDDSFQSFLVKNAYFTPLEEYPILPENFIAKEVPKKILPFSKAINYRGDLSETFICTYESDYLFERIRRNPKKYISFFQRTAGLIGFDYSIHSDMPIIKQKSQMNDNLSLTYYFGNNGIPIIPNIRCGVDELLPELFQAIPKNSLIAIGVHGFKKYKFEIYEWYCFLEQILDKLQPKGIIVYGNLDNKIFDSFRHKYKFYFYTPWIYGNRNEGKKNVH